MELKFIWQSMRMLIWMTILTGLLYPILITAISYLAFREQATGSLLSIDGQLRGSRLIAQKFSQERYFWSRPSVVDFDSLSSGGSNLGPTSKKLKQQVEQRRSALIQSNGLGTTKIPADLLFASGSGLDPHITPEAAYYQLERVAKARGLDSQQLRKWVDERIEKPTLRVMGNARINVLMLNQFLDENIKHG